MLFHILSSPNNLLPRVTSELLTAQNPDGTLDVTKLTSLPLVQSIYAETLRLYVAGNITRTIDSDLNLNGWQLRKGAVVMGPTWLAHRDPESWKNFHPDHPPADVFYAERFLRRDGESITFSSAGLGGKYFPYGGGAHMCPGRIFAKQEMLGALATVLLGYDIEVLGWVDASSGRQKKGFAEINKRSVGSGVVSADRDMRVRLRRRKNLRSNKAGESSFVI